MIGRAALATVVLAASYAIVYVIDRLMRGESDLGPGTRSRADSLRHAAPLAWVFAAAPLVRILSDGKVTSLWVTSAVAVAGAGVLVAVLRRTRGHSSSEAPHG